MGCDIHFYVERRASAGAPWQTADKWTEDKYEEGVLIVDYKDHFYTGRSYDLFAILANVRNGSGFAGVRTGSGFVPIAMPRGVPEDACPEYRAEAERYGEDGHSHSYFTVAELLEYDWTQVTTHEGFVTLEEWAEWKTNGKPSGWCGGVGGRDVRILDESDIAARCKALKMHPGWIRFQPNDRAELNESLGGGSVYTHVSWEEPYHRSCAHFWSECIPRLLHLGPPENVRIVFYFDN